MNLKELAEKKEEVDKLLRKEGKKALTETFKEIFEAVPEVESIYWQQYTPYFNDGDPCTFGVHEFGATFNVEMPRQEYIAGTYNQPGGSEYRTVMAPTGDKFDEIAYLDDSPIAKRLARELKKVKVIDDVFLAAFGDGVEVTVTRKGVDIEEIDHD